ncbi:MAG: hypothetical protein GXP08_09200 [Gammaproteobacteria bacterium]|nr:hypothetical protein [Gammaproteobacteria bacterium]
MNVFVKCAMVFTVFLFNSSVNAGVFRLMPPSSLNIDSQNVTSGIFTLESFSGFNMSLSETMILDLGSGADDISHQAAIGTGEVVNLLNYSDIFSIVQFDYSFDATIPDLAAISANVLSATTNFIISLPSFSTTTNFFEVIDVNGIVSFHTTKPTLDFSASGTTNIDLFGDASIFATFGGGDVQLLPSQFQSHGIVSVIPIPATVWLFGAGLIVLIGMKRKAI